MGRRYFFQVSTSQVACSTPSVYIEEMVCLKTFAFTGVECAWWDNKYHRSKKTQCSVSPKSPFSSHQSAQFMTFFWPVKIFPLWKLGPERRDSDNNRGPTDAPQTRWYHLHVLHFSPSQHLLVFDNDFNLDDLRFTKFKRQIIINMKRGISKTMMILIMVHAMSHLMSALLTISRAGRRRKMTQWGGRLGKYANNPDNGVVTWQC